MVKKDFSKANINPVYDAIAEATAAQEEPQETIQTHEETVIQVGRKTYTAAEAQEFLAAHKTSGRKGVKLPRLNMAFSPEIYDYIKTMSKVSGITLTDFVNRIMQQHLNEHREQYDRALEFRNSL